MKLRVRMLYKVLEKREHIRVVSMCLDKAMCVALVCNQLYQGGGV
jgi:hypothetical protein